MSTQSVFAHRGCVSGRGKRKGSKREGYWAAMCRGLPAHPLTEFEPRVGLGSGGVEQRLLVHVVVSVSWATGGRDPRRPQEHMKKFE